LVTYRLGDLSFLFSQPTRRAPRRAAQRAARARAPWRDLVARWVAGRRPLRRAIGLREDAARGDMPRAAADRLAGARRAGERRAGERRADEPRRAVLERLAGERRAAEARRVLDEARRAVDVLRRALDARRAGWRVVARRAVRREDEALALRLAAVRLAPVRVAAARLAGVRLAGVRLAAARFAVVRFAVPRRRVGVPAAPEGVVSSIAVVELCADLMAVMASRLVEYGTDFAIVRPPLDTSVKLNFPPRLVSTNLAGTSASLGPDSARVPNVVQSLEIPFCGVLCMVALRGALARSSARPSRGGVARGESGHVFVMQVRDESLA
jgi:hypothetical protein